MLENIDYDNNALYLLRQQHAKVRSLLSTCWVSYQPDFIAQACQRLIKELRAHNMMEQQCFYPFAQDTIDLKLHPASLTEEHRLKLEDDTLNIEQLLVQLEELDPSQVDFKETLNRLISVFERHIYHVEEYLVIPLEDGDWDQENQLVMLARQMQDRYDESVSSSRLDNPPA